MWAFWGLVAYEALSLLVLRTFLRETAGNVVGNGDRPLKARWARTWWNMSVPRIRARSGVESGHEEKCSQGRRTGEPIHPPGERTTWDRSLKLIDFCGPVLLISYKDTFLILWMAASAYANRYCIQSSNPSIYKDMYQFNELKIGFSYIPGRVGVVLGAYANGRLMDRNYTITAKESGVEVDRVVGDDLDVFPIERARIRSCWVLHSLPSFTWVGYGCVPLLLQFVHGILCTCLLQTFNTLLVDIFPNNTSSAATSGNIT